MLTKFRILHCDFHSSLFVYALDFKIVVTYVVKPDKAKIVLLLIAELEKEDSFSCNVY